MLVDDVAIDGKWQTGTAGDDIIVGGTGDDYVAGGEGADVLSGGDGNDLFAGLSDDDWGDTFTGGAGRDTYTLLPTEIGAQTIVARSEEHTSELPSPIRN